MIKTVVEESPKNIAIMDVFSKLIQERIIFIDGEITNELANEVIAQMLYLNSIDSKKTIDIYINSPGGYVSAGLAIYDAAHYLKCPIRTVCIGTAASIAGILMLIGQERCILKHSKIMFHQLSYRDYGKLSDMGINYDEAKKSQIILEDIIKEKTNIKEVNIKDDTWYNAEESLKFGIVNKIL